MDLGVRKTRADETDVLMAMFDYSRNLMRAAGNRDQWVGGYPQRSLVENDIAKGQSYVVTEGDAVAGTFVFFTDEEPTYRTIHHGHWMDESEGYGTMHRMARSEGRHGIAAAAIGWCAQRTESLRADTHEDNYVVQRLLERHNFVYCGMIQLEDGSWRKAYQRMNYLTVTPQLRMYVEERILPLYDNFDEAHGRSHVLRVMAQSMALARHYGLNADMVYTIAAFHDAGLREGRDTHHVVSGRYIRTWPILRQWFDAEQIEVMAQAAEDHRASSLRAPRSIYGMIVAEADRDIDSERIVLRALQFGLEHCPEAGKEGQWHRMVSHLREKYGADGYMKLWIPESANARRLEELRRLMEDEVRLRQLFERLYRPKQESGADDDA